MKVSQMKYFVAVCEYGTVNLASKALFVTQPTISTSIALIEKEYNIKLFNRKQKSLELTDNGKFFYKRAKLLLEMHEKFENDLRDLSTKDQVITIGMPPMIGSFLFPKIYNDYTLKNIDTKFEIIEEGSLKIRKKVAEKSLDLGFSIINESLYDENKLYEVEVVYEAELMFCVSKNNRLAKYKDVTFDDIKDEPIVMMNKGYYQTKLVLDRFAKAEVEPNITLKTSQLSVLANFVRMDLGGAFLLKELIDPNDESIVAIPFKDKAILKIGLLWQKDIELHVSKLNFVKYIKEMDFKS